MHTQILLHQLPIGKSAIIEQIRCEGSMHRRLLDIGLIEGTRVTCVGRSPGGDPAAYCIRGAVIAIRDTDAKRIHIIL